MGPGSGAVTGADSGFSSSCGGLDAGSVDEGSGGSVGSGGSIVVRNVVDGQTVDASRFSMESHPSSKTVPSTGKYPVLHSQVFTYSGW